MTNSCKKSRSSGLFMNLKWPVTQNGSFYSRYFGTYRSDSSEETSPSVDDPCNQEQKSFDNGEHTLHSFN